MPTITISGMSCQHCVASVAKALSEIKGVTDVSVDLEKKEASYAESTPVNIGEIKEAIAKIGFEVIG